MLALQLFSYNLYFLIFCFILKSSGTVIYILFLLIAILLFHTYTKHYMYVFIIVLQIFPNNIVLLLLIQFMSNKIYSWIFRTFPVIWTKSLSFVSAIYVYLSSVNPVSLIEFIIKSDIFLFRRIFSFSRRYFMCYFL